MAHLHLLAERTNAAVRASDTVLFIYNVATRDGLLNVRDVQVFFQPLHLQGSGLPSSLRTRHVTLSVREGRDHQWRVSRILTATPTPKSSVSAATVWIAAAMPSQSASSPARRAFFSATTGRRSRVRRLGRYADYSLLIFGMLYGLALLFLPRGLCGELSAWAALRAQKPRDG